MNIHKTADGEPDVIPDAGQTKYNGTYKIIVRGFDWGPAAVKAIIKLKNTVTQEGLCTFSVTEIHGDERVFERKITDAYLSDQNGSKSASPSKYITLEMSAAPSGEGLVFYYDRSIMRNVWDNKYRLFITAGNPVNAGLSNLAINPEYTEAVTPQTDKFRPGKFSSGDITISYASFEPEEDSRKHPLIIWLHGQGEGGSDASIALLGNKVTALAEAEIQYFFEGAYVLCPQCPTYWPEVTPGEGYLGMKPSANSAYQKELMQLIEKYTAGHAAVDTDRIYIGGCSMGGYMTLNMVNQYPGYFAAAFPVCDFYPDMLITDKMTAELCRLPLWFTYCSEDDLVIPSYFCAATISRLQKAGALNLHVSVFEDVHDTSGKYTGQNGGPYKYSAHWSWIYLFNNECFDSGVNMWKWLSEQRRQQAPVTSRR